MAKPRPMSPAAVRDLIARDIWSQWRAERARLDRLDRWLRHDPEPIQLPQRSTIEHRALAAMCRTPWLSLIVGVMSQATLVDGYRSPDEPTNSTAWRLWEANDLDARQVSIHRAAYGYGYAYGSALPGVLPNGAPMPAIRGVSPRGGFAVYADPADDDWPMFFLRVKAQPGGYALSLFDEQFTYMLAMSGDGGSLTFIETREHGAGVVPFVRYSPRVDLEGRTDDASVEPYIPLAARINKDDFDRMLAQHFGSWQIRYVTGMAKPDTDEAANAAKLLLRQEDILSAEDPNAKIGVLPPTPLDGLIAAHQADVETLSAVSQTPTDALTGKMVNLSADALASTRAQFDQKIGEAKTGLGKAHGQLLRLAAQLAGDDTAAGDLMARVSWQDTSIRSLASAADALGKIATSLGVPVQGLWPLIPGVTKSDVEAWKALAAQGDPLTAFGDLLERQAAGLAGAPGAVAGG